MGRKKYANLISNNDLNEHVCFFFYDKINFLIAFSQ